MEIFHLPVMPEEVVSMLGLKAGGRYLDATIGPGGHAGLILDEIGPGGVLIGMDRDEQALKQARKNVSDERLTLVKANFSEMRDAVEKTGQGPLDGVLMDFGLSMLQLKTEGRGMSFTSDEPLDMRMDLSSPLTAEEVVNTWPQAELERILRDYGEERKARRVAAAIVRRRRKARITTCRELAGIVASAVGGRGRIHPATRTFQAIRIAVNNEIEEIRRGLEAALTILASGGRLVTIAYHSLEDREVKHFLKRASARGEMKILTKKPLRPSRAEVVRNPASRSAKLRAGEAL